MNRAFFMFLALMLGLYSGHPAAEEKPGDPAVEDSATVQMAQAEQARWARCLQQVSQEYAPTCDVLAEEPSRQDRDAWLRWSDLQARAYMNRIGPHLSVTQIEAFEPELARGMALAQDMGAPVVAARWLFAEWSRRSMLGQHELALGHARVAIDLLLDADEPELLASMFHSLSISFAALGRLGELRWALGRALMLSEDSSDDTTRRAILSDAGSVHMRLGDLAQANHYFEQALAQRNGTESALLFRTAMRWGELLRRRGEARTALDVHTRLTESVSGQGPLARHELAVAIARDHVSLGQFELAQSQLEWLFSEANVREAVLIDGLLVALRSAIEAADGYGVDVVEQRLRTRVMALPPDSYPFRRLTLLGRLMAYHRAHDNLSGAREYAQRTSQLLFRVQSQLRSSSYRDVWSDGVAGAIEQLVRIAVTGQAPVDEVFDVLETYYSARPRYERDDFAVSPHDSEQSLALWEQYVRLNRVVAEQGAEGEESDDAGEARSAALRAGALRDQLFGLGADPSQRKQDQAPQLALFQLQQRMPADHLLLRYFVAEGDSFVLLIARDLAQLLRIPDETEIERLADAVLIEPQDSMQQAQPLLRELVPIGAALDGVSRLVIIADKALHRLPLEAVDWEGPIGERIEVVRTYSATDYYAPLEADLSGEPVSASSVDFAVFTNPDFRSGAAAQPLAARSWSRGLPRLPYSELEAQAIIDNFEQADIRHLNGAAATAGAMLDDVTRGARIVHIATHGYFDPEVSGAVGLAGAGTGAGDGFVSLPELLRAPFAAELMVVSGCQTMLGRYHLGRGFNSLTRGLATQGVRAVIGTIRPVGDRSAAQFNSIFYRHLAAQPGNVARALMLARQEASRQLGVSAWAAFTLTATHARILHASLRQR